MKGQQLLLAAEEKCASCKACIAACPYDARLIMWPEGCVDDYTFCHHRVDQGLDPACVSACPTRCMYFGNLDDRGGVVDRPRGNLRTRWASDSTLVWAARPASRCGTRSTRRLRVPAKDC